MEDVAKGLKGAGLIGGFQIFRKKKSGKFSSNAAAIILPGLFFLFVTVIFTLRVFLLCLMFYVIWKWYCFDCCNCSFMLVVTWL